MYFSIQLDRQVDSLADNEEPGAVMQFSKQFWLTFCIEVSQCTKLENNLTEIKKKNGNEKDRECERTLMSFLALAIAISCWSCAMRLALVCWTSSAELAGAAAAGAEEPKRAIFSCVVYVGFRREKVKKELYA